MSILNLAIGLHTESAKAEMRSLAAWLKENAPNVGVTLDVKSLKNQLAELNALPVINVKVNAGLVKAEIGAALKEAFSTRHTVLINTDALTKSVHDAAADGLKGLKAHVAASSTGAAQPGAASAVSSAIDTAVISTAVRDAVATTSDMMAKTFGDVMSQQAKKSKGAASASLSQSVTAPDGTKGSVRVPIGDEKELKNLLAQIDDQTALKAAEKRNKEMQDLDAGEEARRSRYIKESDKALNAKKSIDAAWAQAEEDARAKAEAAKERAWNAFDNAQVAQQKKALDARKKMGEEEVIAQNAIEKLAREQDAAIRKRNQAQALAEDAAARQEIEGRMKRAKDLRRAQVDQQIAANKLAEQVQKDMVKAETLLSRKDSSNVKAEDSRLNRNQKGEESQAAAAMANRASEQIRAARGIYNASKMEMGRLLNEQGASISALATVMAKIPGVDPTEIVNNPAKIERARQLLSVWKEGAAGAERLDRMMAQYQKTTAKAEDGQKNLNKAIREFYTAQKFAAGADKQLTGRGAQVTAAAATVDKFGPGAVTNALGNDALVREAQALQNGTAKLSDYHKKMKEAAGGSNLLRNGINDAHSAARGLAGSLGAIWVTWGSTVPLAGMAAIGASLRATYLVGKDVEYQLKFVSLLAGNASISIQEFNSAIKGTSVAPVDAAKALRGLAQNGLSAADALRALPAILRLATAGEMELMDAALGATGVMAAFNLGIGDLGRVSDVFAFAAAKSNTSVGAMVEAMKQASTVSDQYGLTLEETAASLATLAKRNIEGSAAGTALRNMMTELAAPTDKARRAMKELHLDLYDGTDRLKGYKQVIEELRGATIVLNEKSRITFLNELFDERGAKAANALLSDFGLLSDLFKELEKNATGFTGVLVSGLQETVQGSVKGLVSDFQQSVQQVFEESKTSVKDFIETLREAARSEDFKNFLRTTGEVVLDITSFLVEHGKVIALTVAGWMGLRAAMAMAASVGALVTALKAAEVGLTGVRIAALGAASAMTGGIALVTTLALEYLLLRDNTSEAEKAHESFQAAMRRGIQTMQDEDDRLRDLNSRLRTRNELLAQGLTVKQVEERMTGTPSTAIQEKEAALKLRQEKLETAKKAAAEGNRKAALVGYPKELDPFFEESRRKSLPLSEVFKQEQRDIDAQRMSLSVAKATARRLEEDQKTNRDLNEKDRYRTELANLRVERDDIMKRMKDFKVPLPDFSDTGMPAEEMKRQIQEYKNAKNAALQNRMPDTTEDRARRTRAEADARSAAHAALMGEIKAVRDKEQVVKDEIKAQEQLNKAKYDPAIYGEQTVAMLSELQAQNALNSVYEAQKRVVTELTALKAGKSKTEAQQIDNAIEEVNRQAQATQREINLNKQLAEVKAENEKRKKNLSTDTTAAEQDIDFQRIMADIQRKSDRKTVDPAIQARNEAIAKVAEADAQRILSAQARVSALEAGRSALLEKRQDLRGEDLKALDQVLAKNAMDIELETRKLNIMKEQSVLNQTNAGELARSNEEYARSWQGGWDEYWKQFREGAMSNADIVKSVMGTTTESMTQMFSNFVTTGKLNFRSFASTVIAEAARVMAAKAVGALLNFLVSSIAGAFGGASGGTSVNGSAGTPDMSGFALTGGVWPDTPGLPTLRRFRKGGVGGGVSFGPTYTEHAEGAKPEAYVPLEDGRNIPVKVLSDGGSGGSFMVNTYVTIDSSGKPSSRVETDDSFGKKIGTMVEQAVTEKLVEQMQPGGVLYNRVKS